MDYSAQIMINDNVFFTPLRFLQYVVAVYKNTDMQ